MNTIRKRWRNRRGTWWWAILVIVVPVAGLTGTAVWLLPTLVDVVAPGDQLEIIRIALTVGAGTGGVVALVLAGRRQWSIEHAHKATEHDAAERRITELYTKAVDQLGSDHAAVRLGGLYALERLANTTPTQQSTIGNVICAYLRMPYTSPPNLDADATDDIRKEHDRLVQEFETRRTALEILVQHRHRQGWNKRWPDLHIRLQRANLTGADLSNADLTGADLYYANLSKANLDKTELINAHLSNADLTGANLTGANLSNANLTGANLTGAHLINVDLTNANLTNANLNNARLSSASLAHATLTNTNLSNARLSNTNLSNAHLNNTDLSNTDLTTTDLTNANLSNIDLSNTRLTYSQRMAAGTYVATSPVDAS